MSTERVAATPGFSQLLSQVCDPSLDLAVRQDLFASLLEAVGGPFSDSDRPMIDSVRALARLVTTTELRRRSLPGSYLDPEEVAHDALLVFFQQCHKIRDLSAIRSWFWGVMRLRVGKLLGSHPQVEVCDVVLDNLASPAGSQDDVRVTQLDEAKSQAVVCALQELSPSLRSVVELRVFNGLTHVETARALGIDPTAVRVRWIRARRILESKLVAYAR
jgi:RNA polymerase sigma factor (sigma-70 family)